MQERFGTRYNIGMLEALFGWAVVGTAVGVLITVGVGVLSMPTPQYIVSQCCFAFAAALLIGRIAWWLGFEQQPTTGGWVLAFLLVGGVAVAWVATAHWVNGLKVAKQQEQTTADKLAQHGQTLNDIKALLEPVKDSRYRELVAAVIHAFDPKAKLLVSASIEGPDGLRTVDIEVRSVVDGKQTLTAIDVVELPPAKKAGIETIDAADSKRTDINADNFLVCSNTGFDEAAIRKAKRKRIGVISVLRQGDQRVKAVIEEEIYLRKIDVAPITFTYDAATQKDGKRLRKLKPTLHALRYQDWSVDAWLQERIMEILVLNPYADKPIRVIFKLKQPSPFSINGQQIELKSISVTFHPKVQWLSQTVQIDATMGIYDYVRGRVRLAGGTQQYTLKDVNFDTAVPMASPPSISDLGVGLRPGEIDLGLMMLSGLNMSNQKSPSKFSELIRPEDLILKLPRN